MLTVRKTPKLYINGAFTRSESGRTFEIDAGGQPAHVARATRKDMREAVRSARAAQPKWWSRTAYNRGQVLYRCAEMLQGRRADFIELLTDAGATGAAAGREIDASIERAVWYAGWCDKIEQLLSTKNPVAGPHFNVSSPEPTGLVAIVAPQRPALLGLVSTVMPALCGGNAVVVLASEIDPLTAIGFAEVLATGDIPAGVANVLTGLRAEIVEDTARHMDVNALDLWIADATLAKSAMLLGSESVKRVRTSGEPPLAFWYGPKSASPRWIEAFMEIKTVWHPAGL